MSEARPDQRLRTRTKATTSSGTMITAVMSTGHMWTASLIEFAAENLRGHRR